MKDRYTELQERLAAFNGASAMAVTLLVVGSCWGDWALMGTILVMNVLVIAFNMWITFWLLPRMGHAAEFVRVAVNTPSNALIGHFAGWPLAIWLWLPYVALVADHTAPRVLVGTVLFTCLVYDVLALVDGVAPIYPIVFTALAFFCLEVSRLRFLFIRSMLHESDEDRTELARAHSQLHQEVEAREAVELELRHAQKLQAVGRLAAGIAHEINTPVQFVTNSVAFLDGAVADLLGLARKQGELLQREPALAAAGAEAARDADLEFLETDAPLAVKRALDGLGRVAGIVRSMQTFASPARTLTEGVDLGEAIRSTLVVAAHEYRRVADVTLELDPIPLVRCNPGEINQVILNLLVNAGYAIEDRVGATGARGTITVGTRRDGDDVLVSVRDTGVGIPYDVQSRIFEPFFTTRGPGRGSGQGLAISRAVVEKHGGRITFESVPGAGAHFCVRLPIAGAPPAEGRPEGGAAQGAQ